MPNQKGFTLIELMIVIIIIGLLASVVAPKFMGSTDKAKTTTKWIAAEQISQCISAYTLNLGLSSNDPTNIPNFLESGNTMLDVVMGGDVAVIAAADARFNAESLKCEGLKKVLKTVSAPTAGTPGNYTIDGNRVTVSNGSATEIDVNLDGVSTTEVQAMAFSYGNATAFDSSSAGSAGSIRWSALAGTTHTLTIRLPKM